MHFALNSTLLQLLIDYRRKYNFEKDFVLFNLGFKAKVAQDANTMSESQCFSMVIKTKVVQDVNRMSESQSVSQTYRLCRTLYKLVRVVLGD